MRPRCPVQHRHDNRVIRPAGAQALHHPMSGASPLQHIQVRLMERGHESADLHAIRCLVK